ncbi:hypothetical protein ACHQM5_021189 [Ranunculus cassubicifolius]
MSVGFRQWESDPLFSAAEVVQDSADRMDSIFRIFLHEQSLVQDDPIDQKLHSSVDYHRRDLVTALGTTKWQLEDFERAVNLSVFSDASNLRDDAISRHKQFIRAVDEQITQVERSLESLSTGISEPSTQWMNLNEKDRDGLASFLSGGYPGNHAVQHEADGSIMRRFFDSTKASEFDSKSDEIVELKTEDDEDSHVNGVLHIGHNIDNMKKNTLKKVSSSFYTRPGFETSISIEDENNEGGSWELQNDTNAKSFFAKNKLRGSHSSLDVFRLLSNVWSVYGGKMARRFAKRRNDKDGKKDCDQNLSESYADITQSEKGIYKNSMPSYSWASGWDRGALAKWHLSNTSVLIVGGAVLAIFIFSKYILFFICFRYTFWGP